MSFIVDFCDSILGKESMDVAMGIIGALCFILMWGGIIGAIWLSGHWFGHSKGWSRGWDAAMAFCAKVDKLPPVNSAEFVHGKTPPGYRSCRPSGADRSDDMAESLRAATLTAAGHRDSIFGRMGKPFHRPECVCTECLDWIEAHPLPSSENS